MNSLTALVVALSVLSNIGSLQDDPTAYKTNYMNKVIAITEVLENHSDPAEANNESIALDIVEDEDNQVLGISEVSNDLPDSFEDGTVNEELAQASETNLEPSHTPTESPVPTPTFSFDNFDQVGAVERAANEYGVDMNLMKSIATCESGFNAYAHNERYDYAGLFQFNQNTWISTRNRMGLDPNPALRFSAEEAAKTAAFKIKNDGPGAWKGCL